MGLDLYHFQAVEDRSGAEIVIDPGVEDLKVLQPLSYQTTNQYIDWEKMFASKDLSVDDHQLVSRTMASSASLFRIGKIDETYTFISRLDGTEISFSNKPAPLFKLPFGKQKPKVFSGAFTYRPQQDTVVSAHQAGYQRKDVDEQFFNEFPPDLITTDFSRVQRIHELTLPYAKDAYRQAFVDNWSPSCSFLIVSW